MQTLNSPTDAEGINSLHDFIFRLHRPLIEAISHVVFCSGTGTITRDLNLTVIDFVKPSQIPSGLKALVKQTKSPSYIINMSKAMIINAQSGLHVCVIEMLEQAESGKGRTLHLSLSDDFTEKYFQGKLNRCLYIALLLKTIFNNAELNANITHINTSEKMQNGFLKVLSILLSSPGFYQWIID